MQIFSVKLNLIKKHVFFIAAFSINLYKGFKTTKEK